jgi:hypothetical protein
MDPQTSSQTICLPLDHVTDHFCGSGSVFRDFNRSRRRSAGTICTCLPLRQLPHKIWSRSDINPLPYLKPRPHSRCCSRHWYLSWQIRMADGGRRAPRMSSSVPSGADGKYHVSPLQLMCRTVSALMTPALHPPPPPPGAPMHGSAGLSPSCLRSFL